MQLDTTNSGNLLNVGVGYMMLMQHEGSPQHLYVQLELGLRSGLELGLGLGLGGGKGDLDPVANSVSVHSTYMELQLCLDTISYPRHLIIQALQTD